MRALWQSQTQIRWLTQPADMCHGLKLCSRLEHSRCYMMIHSLSSMNTCSGMAVGLPGHQS